MAHVLPLDLSTAAILSSSAGFSSQKGWLNESIRQGEHFVVVFLPSAVGRKHLFVGRWPQIKLPKVFLIFPPFRVISYRWLLACSVAICWWELFVWDWAFSFSYKNNASALQLFDLDAFCLFKFLSCRISCLFMNLLRHFKLTPRYFSNSFHWLLFLSPQFQFTG